MKRVVSLLSGILPVFFLFPVMPTAVPRDANVTKDAWWSFYGQGLPLATPTTVPADALGVGHNIAQPDKVAAIHIGLTAPLGSTIQTLALTLKEAEGPGANAGQAAVVACPVTGPWEPAVNGNWVDVPDYDCTLGKAAGKRADDGTWTFDLGEFGAQWLDADFPLEQAGILLLIEVSTQPVQVSFRSIKTGEFRLEFAAAAPTQTEPVEPVVVGGLETPAEAPAPQDAAPQDAPAPVETTPEVILTQPTQAQTENSSDPDILGNLPWGAWLLVPILIGGGAAVSYALGPGARRRGAGRRREGAVSRALSREAQDG